MSRSDAQPTEPYKGVRDFYPEEWSVLANVFETLRKTLHRWSYEEYNASPLERAELYESKTSEEIVSEQTYTFEDRGGRRVTLRPEMTPTFARMLSAKRREVPFPVRWFSIPNVFRYERPQRGRLREHYQLNVDLAGIPGSEADIEIVAIASSLLKSFGATEKDFVMRISSRELLTKACESANISEEDTRSYIRLLDRKNKMTPEEFRAGVSALADIDPLALIEANDPKISEAKSALMEVIETLAKRGVTNVVFDPTITRGFDYYTGMVFEVFDTDVSNPRSLFGGGRYDGLVTLFGGDPVPCVGFGMGDVTLMDFLETHGLTPNVQTEATLYVGTPSIEDIAEAQLFANELRAQGISVLVHVSGKGLGDQIKDALKRNVPYFIAYGSNEANSASVTIKKLAENSEESVSKETLANHLLTN